MTWYFDAVLPGVFGTPQPFYFPFTRWYWCDYSPSVVNVDDTDADLPDYGDRSARFEPSVSGRKVGIKIRNLTKRFSKNQQPAVDRLSIDLYERDITALLGHNGAGKTTTMFILTGFLRPTGGTAYVNGLSIRRDMVKIRESLGLCPQHDVLFDTMTVEEHLAFFATLKGCPRHEVNRAVHRMTGVLHLEAKSSTVSKDLSGGMKRKLCVGIALIADYKVVVLDEPTSGMDPEARRQTWDILQSQRAGRTMILSTHFMEEADILDDRIAIMAGGQLQCYGSSLFLKNIYGTGYRLNIVKNILCIPENVLNVIRVHVPGVRLESNVGAELSFVLPKEQSANFEKLFTDLENNHTVLGIDSFGASLTTLQEEVFLKAMETGDDTLQDNLQNSRVQSHTQTSGGTSSTGAASGTSTSDDEMFGVRFRRTTGAASLALQRSHAMLVKHAVHSWRNRIVALAHLLPPVIFTIIACVIAQHVVEKQTDPPSLLLSLAHFNDRQCRLWAYYSCGTSTIRVRFEHDSATTRYEVFRALAYEIDSSTPRQSVVGVSCMLIDSSMHTIFTLYRPKVYLGLPYIVCV